MSTTHRTFSSSSSRSFLASAASPTNRRSVVVFLLAAVAVLLSLVTAVSAVRPSVTRTSAAGGGSYAVADVFVANISVSADTSSGWPSTTSGFAVLTTNATNIVASSLSLDASQVSAFFVQSGTSVAALQIRVVSIDIVASRNVYLQLASWTSSASGSANLLSSITSTAMVTLGNTGLSTLAYRSGVTTMPCRSQEAYDYLPVCAPVSIGLATAEAPLASLWINTTSAATTVQTAICNIMISTTASLTTPVTDCTPYLSMTTSSSAANAYIVANIHGLGNSLEMALMFVDSVRRGTAGVAATKILLGSGGSTSVTGTVGSAYDSPATVYASNENAPYGDSPFYHPECSPLYGLWGVALIAAPFVALIAFWFVYHRGRHRSKKRERERIQRDEMENMRAYSAPGGVDAANMGGYPGMWGQQDPQQQQQQYAVAGDDGAAGSYMYDPATGAYYVVGDDGTGQTQADEYYDSAAYPAQQEQLGEDGYYQEGDGGAGEVNVTGDAGQWVDEQAYNQQQQQLENDGGYVEEGAYDDNAAAGGGDGVYDENAGGEQQVVMGEDGNYYYVNDVNNGAGQA